MKRMVSLLTAAALLLALLPALSVSAAESYYTYYDHPYYVDCVLNNQWWYYVSEKDGGAVVVKYLVDETDVTVPDTLGGYPVVTISSEVFRNRKNMKSLTIPDCVVRIDGGALCGCGGLTDLTLPFVGREPAKSLSALGLYPLGYLFGTKSYLGGVKTVQTERYSDGRIDSSNTYYIPASLRRVTVTGAYVLPTGAFENCTDLTSVTLKATTAIGGYAFAGCTGLTSFTVPESVGEIKTRAFKNCTGLTAITVPDSVFSIGSYTFAGCTGLTHITLPHCSNVIMGALSDCTGLTDVVLGPGVTRIGMDAFKNCSNLTTIAFSNQLTSIGLGAFSGCPNLTTVRYTGTEQQRIPAMQVLDGAVWEYSEPTVTNLKATLTGDTAITLSWDPVAGADGYKITGIDSKGYYHYGDTADTQITFPSSLMYHGRVYSFKVWSYTLREGADSFAWHKVRFGAFSDTVSIKTKPRLLRIYSGNKSPTSFTVGWRSEGAEGAQVYFFKTGKTYTVKGNSRQFTGLNPGTSYRIKVRAFDTVDGKRRYTAWKTYTPSTLPARVKKPKMSYKKGKLTVKWGKVTGATGYTVSLVSGDPYVKKTRIISVTGCSLTRKLPKGFTYYVRVQAFRKRGKATTLTGAYSPTASLKAK